MHRRSRIRKGKHKQCNHVPLPVLANAPTGHGLHNPLNEVTKNSITVSRHKGSQDIFYSISNCRRCFIFKNQEKAGHAIGDLCSR